MKIELLKGDITRLKCDAIVNAANSRLRRGGGVDGAIHEKAGPRLQAACSRLGGCNPGEAKITDGYNLPAKYVIHAVGPIWENGVNREEDILKKTYESALKLARERGLKSIAFPNISTGVYGFPKNRAAKIATDVVKANSANNGLSEVYFVCFDEENFNIYQDILK